MKGWLLMRESMEGRMTACQIRRDKLIIHLQGKHYQRRRMEGNKDVCFVGDNEGWGFGRGRRGGGRGGGGCT